MSWHQTDGRSAQHVGVPSSTDAKPVPRHQSLWDDDRTSSTTRSKLSWRQASPVGGDRPAQPAASGRGDSSHSTRVSHDHPAGRGHTSYSTPVSCDRPAQVKASDRGRSSAHSAPVTHASSAQPTTHGRGNSSHSGPDPVNQLGTSRPAPAVRPSLPTGFSYASAVRPGAASTATSVNQWPAASASGSADVDRHDNATANRHGSNPVTAASSGSCVAQHSTSTQSPSAAPDQQSRTGGQSTGKSTEAAAPAAASEETGNGDDGFEEISARRSRKKKKQTALEQSASNEKSVKASGKGKQGTSQSQSKFSKQPPEQAAAGGVLKPKFGKAATMDLLQFAKPATAQPVSHSHASMSSRGGTATAGGSAGGNRSLPPSAWPSLATTTPQQQQQQQQQAWRTSNSAAHTPVATVAAVSSSSQPVPASSKATPPSVAATATAAVPRGQVAGAAVAGPRNVLDSTAPVVRRGKEREGGRKKRPTKLKKTILQERETRRQARDALAATAGDGADGATAEALDMANTADGDIDDSEDGAAVSQASDDEDDDNNLETLAVTEAEAALVLPATGSGAVRLADGCSASSTVLACSVAGARAGAGAGAAGEDSQQNEHSGCDRPAGDGAGDDGAAAAAADDDDSQDDTPNTNLDGCMPASTVLHSRKFREYCDHMLDKGIDETTVLLLQRIVFFQDRVFHENPLKAKYRRRYVIGLREVKKFVKSKKLKCVIISPNLERSKSPGGLDEQVTDILTLCQEQQVPAVFALNRRKLGRAMRRKTPASIVGIFNYDGAQEHFHELMASVKAARDRYVAALAPVVAAGDVTAADGTGRELGSGAASTSGTTATTAVGHTKAVATASA